MTTSLIQRIVGGGRDGGVGVGRSAMRVDSVRAGTGQRRVREVLAVFGRAELVHFEEGGHALLGGTPRDLIQAREWISLFGHDVVC